ncbi:MAG: ATP phosphoribosyltransferase, partial [Actinobacteria bacterium]
PKGALFAESVAALADAGLDTGDLGDPGRRLVIDTPDARFVIGKPTDIPIYVAHGAVDCGIAGADVLAESELDVVEMADLRFGGCRFVVAGLAAGPAQPAARTGALRVATKYPRVAEAYFGARGVQTEIVRLNGNIEIAPLIGLADVIVDITATGTTLRENGLVETAEVMASTARFIANPVSLRLRPEVTALAGSLAAGTSAHG